MRCSDLFDPFERWSPWATPSHHSPNPYAIPCCQSDAVVNTQGHIQEEEPSKPITHKNCFVLVFLSVLLASLVFKSSNWLCVGFKFTARRPDKARSDQVHTEGEPSLKSENQTFALSSPDVMRLFRLWQSRRGRGGLGLCGWCQGSSPSSLTRLL